MKCYLGVVHVGSTCVLAAISLLFGCSGFSDATSRGSLYRRVTVIDVKDDGSLLLNEKAVDIKELSTLLKQAVDRGECQEIHLYTGKVYQKLVTDAEALVRRSSSELRVELKEFHARGQP